MDHRNSEDWRITQQGVDRMQRRYRMPRFLVQGIWQRYNVRVVQLAALVNDELEEIHVDGLMTLAASTQGAVFLKRSGSDSVRTMLEERFQQRIEKLVMRFIRKDEVNYGYSVAVFANPCFSGAKAEWKKDEEKLLQAFQKHAGKLMARKWKYRSICLEEKAFLLEVSELFSEEERRLCAENPVHAEYVEAIMMEHLEQTAEEMKTELGGKDGIALLDIAEATGMILIWEAELSAGQRK